MVDVDGLVAEAAGKQSMQPPPRPITCYPVPKTKFATDVRNRAEIQVDGQGRALAIALSTASPSRSTIASSSASAVMKGGARRRWSPFLPSIVPPIG